MGREVTMRHLRTFLTAAALATAVATGCSSSSSVPVNDSGPDSPVTKGDSGHPKTDSGNPPPKGDSGNGMDGSKPHVDGSMPHTDGMAPDGPCNFATFVLGLIANDTTATATPSTDLGQTCTDDQKQSEFATLF
jgi:hypothetical protein